METRAPALLREAGLAAAVVVAEEVQTIWGWPVCKFRANRKDTGYRRAACTCSERRRSPLELELSPLAAHQTDGEICHFAFRCRTLEGWSVCQEGGVVR